MFSTIVSQVINGLQSGSIYALVALGYSMVYGIILLLNFAHGDIIMVGAYVVWYSMSNLGLHPVVSMLLAIIACTLLGMLIEKLAYTPLRSAPRLSLLITAIGVSFLLENGFQLIFGAGAQTVPTLVSGPSLSLGSVTVSFPAMLTLVVSILSMAALTFLVQKTKLGKAMRAVSEDKGAAQLMGINVNHTISVTFAIGSALAAIAGVLLCSAYPVLLPTTGSMPGIKAFTAAVFGGIGSIPGAMVGGILLGIIEIFGKAYISTQLADAIVFSVLIIVLLVKPTGLLGKAINEKV